MFGSNNSSNMMASTDSAGFECNDDNAHGSFYMPEDVRKYGYMRKLKTNKKKFFVLRLNSSVTLSKATLSYYDNEKKFRQNPVPAGKNDKRTVLLTDCFAVARKIDPKHKHVLGLYTKEDLLGLILDDDKQFLEWLQAIRSILYKTPEYISRPLPDFKYIWQGTMNRVSTHLPRSLLGTYRICLMPTTLYLIKVDPNVENPDNYEIQLSCIRRCGHTQATFFLELGRFSVLGSGELWILTEDMVIAGHIHERILQYMSKKEKSYDGDESLSSSQNSRPRSSSTSIADFKSNNTNNNNSQSLNVRNSGGAIGLGNITANPRVPHLVNTTGNFRHHSMFEHVPGAGTAAMANIPPFAMPPPHIFSHFLTQFGPPPVTCCHGRTAAPGIASAGNASSSSQSPTNSRERLHSGSWSRTASDCSNEDLSGSSSTATTPVGPPGSTHYFDCATAAAKAAQFWSSASMMHPGHSFPMDPTKPNSSNSSLSTEYDMVDHIEHGPHFAPPSYQDVMSPEEAGFGADLDMYGSHNNASHPPVTSQQQAAMYFWMFQMLHQQMVNGHYQSRSTSSTGSHNQSPVNSPKCPCTGTAASAHSLSAHRPYLPTIPAGEPSDYVPMSPMNDDGTTIPSTVRSKPIECTVKEEEEEESSYLHMAPLSPNSKSNPHSTPTSSATNPASASNSMEFHLDKVRSYVSPEDETITAQKPSSAAPSTQEDSFFDGLTRAYSTGSKPQPLARSIGAQCTNSPAAPLQPSSTAKDNSHLRTRAFSTGSHGMKFRAFRLNSRRKKQNQANNCTPENDGSAGVSTSASSSSLPEENIGSQKSHKAASSPILSSLTKPRLRSHTLGSKPFMQNQSSINQATSSVPHPPHAAMFLPLLPMVTDPHALFGGKPCYPVQRSSHPVASSPPNASVIPPPISMPEEGDLMEIDYSAKNKERPQQQINKSDDVIISEFEEEFLREGKKKDVQKERNAHSAQENHRKRSDSTSTLANLFHHGSGSTNQQEQSNHHRSNTHQNHSHKDGQDHFAFLSQFKQSLSFHHHHSKSSKEPESSHKTPPDEENEYMLWNPAAANKTAPDTSSSSKHPGKSFVSSIGSVIQRKSSNSKQSMGTNESSDNICSSPTNCPPTESVPERNSCSSPNRVNLAHDTDEEESSYVMMAPENHTGNSSKSSNGKKHKTSVRSLFSINKNTSSSSGSGSKFKMNRSNSSNQNQRANSNNAKYIRRPGSSKSESTEIPASIQGTSPPIPSSLA